jgi:hypothetical protein
MALLAAPEMHTARPAATAARPVRATAPGCCQAKHGAQLAS